jgi:hypothetical protein
MKSRGQEEDAHGDGERPVAEQVRDAVARPLLRAALQRGLRRPTGVEH